MASVLNRSPGLADIIGRWLSGRSRVSETDAKEADSAETEATQTATGGGSDHEPVVVWTASNPLEARIVKGRLEAEGIPAAIQGEAMGEILGIAANGLATTDVLVPKPLAEQATELLNRDSPSNDLENQ
ncbi:MAG: DUF2007 domain-containing protein [Chloroflexota bacterium]